MTTGVASSAASPYALKTGRFSSHTLLLEQFPAPGRGRRVLDVGGGEGYMGRILSERGYRVTCIAGYGSRGDPFPPAVELIETDLDFDSPKLDGAFAFLLCGDILEHLREPAVVLRRLGARLEPGGRLVASLPNSGHLYVRWNVLRGRFPLHPRGLFDRTHLHFFTWDGWKQVLTEGGWRVETVQPTVVPVELALPRWIGPVALAAFERLSYFLGRCWKTLFAYQFVVTAIPEEH